MVEAMETEMSLAVFDPPRAMVVDLVKKDALQKFDHTTPDGETALRSWVHRVRGGKGDLEKVRVAAKANALAYGKKIDALARELKAPLEKIISERMKPLDEIEATKRARAEAIVEAERVAKEKADAERLADLERREKAIAVKEAETKAIEDAAKIEADKAAAVEAAIKAEQEKAHQAEVDRQAEADRKARVECDKQIIAARQKKQAEEAEAKRVADKEHRNKIEEEIVKRFIAKCSLNTAQALEITAAISVRLIPHIKIIY